MEEKATVNRLNAIEKLAKLERSLDWSVICKFIFVRDFSGLAAWLHSFLPEETEITDALYEG